MVGRKNCNKKQVQWANVKKIHPVRHLGNWFKGTCIRFVGGNADNFSNVPEI